MHTTSLMRRISLLFLFTVTFLHGQAQETYNIKGKVVDSLSGEALIGVNVVLKHFRDSTTFGAVTGSDGAYTVLQVKPGPYQMSLSYVGYIRKEQRLLVRQNMDLGTQRMLEDTKVLGEAKVEGQGVGVVQKGDTTEYNADQYKTNPDADAGDLVKKMPGITVDKGGVKAQGEKVKKVLVDGEEFFGEDAELALKNLPAEIVDKVQVYDRQNEQSQFTGFDDGNTEKTINIVTKHGKNLGQFGKVYAGYGTDDRYESGFNLNFFNGKQRISLIGMSNNINQQNFASDDLLGALAVSGDDGGYRGRRRRSMGIGVNPDDFMVGQQGGISSTHSFGINYQNKWGEKWNMNGSYFLNSMDNVFNSSIAQNYFLNENSNQLYNELENRNSSNVNHRVRFRVDFNPDSLNHFYYRPTFSFQGNIAGSQLLGSNFQSSTLLSQLQNNLSTVGTGYRLDQNLGWRRNLAKPGRTFSVMMGHEMNRNYRDREQLSENLYFDELGGMDSGVLIRQEAWSYSNDQKTDARLVLSERVGQKGMLMLQYRPAYTVSYDDNQIRSLDTMSGSYLLDSALSGDINNKVWTQSAGVNYRFGDRRKFMFMLSMNYEYNRQDALQVFPTKDGLVKRYHNILPMGFFSYSINRTDQLRMFFRSSNQLPSGTQLIEVLDNSNPQRLSIGNIDLEQQINNFMVIRYNKTWTKTGRTFFAFVNANWNRNYIGNSSYVAIRDTVLSGVELLRGTQLDRPVNLDNQYRVSSALTFGTPLRKLKSNLNVNLNWSYNQTPGMINDQLNTTRTNAWNISSVLSSNISDRLDFTLSYAVDINRSRNSLQPQLNNDYLLHAGVAGVTWLPWKGFVLSTQLAYSNYQGLVDGFNQDFLLWNAGLGYKFLKNNAGDLRLKVFDILKQNNSISRSITETYVEDARVNVLQQYFLLTFTYTFRNWRTGAAANP